MCVSKHLCYITKTVLCAFNLCLPPGSLFSTKRVEKYLVLGWWCLAIGCSNNQRCFMEVVGESSALCKVRSGNLRVISAPSTKLEHQVSKREVRVGNKVNLLLRNRYQKRKKKGGVGLAYV